jgi:predicted nuclease of predicted toxin-antitoxin system
VKFFLDHDVPADVGRVLHLKGHTVQFLENVLPRAADDLSAMRYAAGQGLVIVTCNRQDFLRLAGTEPHVGMVILVRRRSRAAECGALLRLIERAGENGIANNINFA